jgi:hypothetical protein
MNDITKFSVEEVYLYYDQPVLFLAKDQDSGQLYFVVFADRTETSNIWLYAPISSMRLNAIKANKIDLKSAFSQTEDNFVYRVEIPRNNSNVEIEEVPCQDLTDNQLPIAGEFLR